MTETAETWLDFLKQQGAHLTNAATSEVEHFGNVVAADTDVAGFVAPLTDLGLLAVSGEDAASFLHNQLTNDVEHLGAGEARLAGYCSPKGRLLATLLMWKSPDAVILQLPRQIQPPIQKRLQMFVLRAKVRLADITDSHAILGIGGEAGPALLGQWFPTLPAIPYSKVESDHGILVRVADSREKPRYQWIAPVEIAKSAWSKLTKTLRPTGTHVWRLTEIRAGIPQITQVTQEQFVPQMINFEAIGGVNFKKGCYPGQEIVARSQYLGKIKRRMMLAMVETPTVQAGMEVFSSRDPEQPCGMVVNAASGLPGQAECLVEIKIAALDEGSIHLGSADGPLLQFSPLPYPLPDPS